MGTQIIFKPLETISAITEESDGFTIKTNQQTIFIDNTSTIEKDSLGHVFFGVCSTSDNVSDFIGDIILNISIENKVLASKFISASDFYQKMIDAKNFTAFKTIIKDTDINLKATEVDLLEHIFSVIRITKKIISIIYKPVQKQFLQINEKKCRDWEEGRKLISLTYNIETNKKILQLNQLIVCSNNYHEQGGFVHLI